MGSPTKVRNVMKGRLKCVQKITDYKDNYEISLHNLQKDHEHEVCEVK